MNKMELIRTISKSTTLSLTKHIAVLHNRIKGDKITESYTAANEIKRNSISSDGSQGVLSQPKDNSIYIENTVQTTENRLEESPPQKNIPNESVCCCFKSRNKQLNENKYNIERGAVHPEVKLRWFKFLKKVILVSRVIAALIDVQKEVEKNYSKSIIIL